jgi:hypothetical protein
MDTNSGRQQQPNEDPGCRDHGNGRVQGEPGVSHPSFRGRFTEDDDLKIRYLRNQGVSWEKIGHMVGRSAKSVRERYNNYLSPHLSFEQLTSEEIQKLFELVNKYGYKWSKFRDECFPNRSDNFLRNQYLQLRKSWDPVSKRNSGKLGQNAMVSGNEDYNFPFRWSYEELDLSLLLSDDESSPFW